MTKLTPAERAVFIMTTINGDGHSYAKSHPEEFIAAQIEAAVATEREGCAKLAASTPQEDCGMVYSNAEHIGTLIRQRS